jgi:hypothetical protein
VNQKELKKGAPDAGLGAPFFVKVLVAIYDILF